MTLLERTAEAIYLTASNQTDDPEPYDRLPESIRREFVDMAVAALTIAYREPVLEEA